MKEKLTQAQLQYYAGMRAMTEDEQKELAIKQAEGCRGMTEKEIIEQQVKMLRLSIREE